MKAGMSQQNKKETLKDGGSLVVYQIDELELKVVTAKLQ